MRDFVKKWMRRPSSERAPLQVVETPMEEADRAVTHAGEVPFYPLAQVLKNQAKRELEAKSPLQTTPQTSSVFSPTIIRRYTGEEWVAEGGTANILKAYDERLRRTVALKRFKISDQGQTLDYLAELESASRVQHPHVVSVYDAEEDETGPFIVMELIKGRNLEEQLAAQAMPCNRAVFAEVAVQILEGLNAVHEGGLLHLDLKPSNIMVHQTVGRRQTAKIVDFGRSMLQEFEGEKPKGSGLDGSIYYSSPEQLMSQELDVRSDLYSLGCVFYTILTKDRPFKGDNALQVMTSHLQHYVEPLQERCPNISPGMAELVMKLVRLDPNDRFQSARETLEALLKELEIERQFEAD